MRGEEGMMGWRNGMTDKQIDRQKDTAIDERKDGWKGMVGKVDGR